MLQTNLATRPFYNERLIHLLLGVGAAVVVAFTVFNALQIVRLSTQQAALGRDAARDEARAADLNARAAAIRGSIDVKALARVTEAAIEANSLVDARAFSWTALFNDIEATLPADVMLTAISPNADADGSTRVRLVVLGRAVESIDTFIERLEKTGHFKRVLAPSERVNEEGLFETTIEGTYRQAPPPAPSPAGAASPGGPGGARPTRPVPTSPAPSAAAPSGAALNGAAR